MPDHRSPRTMFNSIKSSRAATTIAKLKKPKKKPAQPVRGFDALQAFDEENEKPAETAAPPTLQTAHSTVVAAVVTTSQHAADEATEPKDTAGWTQVSGRAASRAPGQSSIAPKRIIDPEHAKEPWKYSDNWRKQDPEINKLRFAAAGASELNKARLAAAASGLTETRARTMGGRYTHSPGPKYSNGMLVADQTRGNVVFHWDIRPYPSRNIPDSDPRIWYDEEGVRCLKKGRYWLIVKVTAKKVCEIPIYTKGDTGLANVDPARWSHYICLRPYGVSKEDYKPQNPDAKYFSMGWIHGVDQSMRGGMMRHTMIARYTEVKARAHEVKDMRLVGGLDPTEIDELCWKATPHIK